MPFRRLQLLRVGALLLALGSAGCSRAPDVHQALDSIHSWTATSDFAAAELCDGATTATYTGEIRDAGRQALADLRRQLAGRPLAADTARQIRSAADSLDAALRRLDAELARR